MYAFYGIDDTISDYNSLGNYLKTIVLPNGITEIKLGAFKRLKELTSITFNTDGMLKTIGKSAVYGEDVIRKVDGFNA